MNKITLYHGETPAVLAMLPDNHFSACVCDPPYELGFMGKKWDSSGIAYDVEMWRQVFRVLKPGAHLLAFGGSRTYHRLACAIEDAGFIIRDQIMWLYGSGFPKSLDVSKGIDKAAGSYKSGAVLPSSRNTGASITGIATTFREKTATNPQTDAARQWEGWGTALKPAHEPIVVARKPLEGTVVANVLKHGTGAINVAGCRVEGPEPHHNYGRTSGEKSFCGEGPVSITPQDGRWPANVIHDGSDELLAEFEKAGKLTSGAKISGSPRKGGLDLLTRISHNIKNYDVDTGSAARFFYCAKASPAERNLGCEGLPLHESRYGKNFSSSDKGSISGSKLPTRNNHPTVKPLALMAYLVRLVTPPAGTVLDPFMGSGSTLIAAAKEGFDAVGIDKEAEYCALAERRCRGHLGILTEITHAP